MSTEASAEYRLKDMADEGGAEAYGQYVSAADVLGHQEEGEEGAEEGSETETETESEESDSEGSETESGSESESGTESGSESGSESESEAAESRSKQASTTGDGEAPQGQALPPVKQASSAGDGEAPQGQTLPPVKQASTAGDEESPSGQVLPPVTGSRPATPDQQPAALADAERGAPQEHLPELPGSRPASPAQQLRSAESSRPASAEPLAQDIPAEAAPLSLPPASSRNSSRECSRKSSHLEATSTGSILGQSSSSLPPINLSRSSGHPQPSRKASVASSQATTKCSQATSPKRKSPTRTSIAAPRYYQPPPPPPPPPKPKPRERHDVSAVDPMFLQTAVYRTVPNVGRVYDWRLQHEVNAALSKQRKQQAQMEKVLEAARLQLQVREANERAFQQWVAAKELEKQQQQQQNRRIAYVTSVYQSLVKDDPIERRTRESLWVGNFPYPNSDVIPARALARGPVSEGFDRFRT